MFFSILVHRRIKNLVEVLLEIKRVKKMTIDIDTKSLFIQVV